MNQMSAPFPTAGRVGRVYGASVKPHKLMDHLITRMNLKNDAALSRFLEVMPPVISKIRNGKLPFGATLIIRTHEWSGMTIAEIKAMLPKKEAA